MVYHEQRFHPSFTPNGTAASFKLNGLPRNPAHRMRDPCIDSAGNPAGTPRIKRPRSNLT